jgi:aryl-alcohol dehydrogenase-like predicted oxidoreductase
VDLFFLHLPPVSVLQQEDLFAALEELTVEGKVLRYGVAADGPVVAAAIEAGMRTVQFPCNVFEPGLARTLANDVLAIANHPFGGPRRIAESKRRMYALAQEEGTPESLRFKLWKLDDVVLADLVLNMITSGTGIKVVVPSMLRLEHLQANVAAVEHSRFTAEELGWVRERLTKISESINLVADRRV